MICKTVLPVLSAKRNGKLNFSALIGQGSKVQTQNMCRGLSFISMSRFFGITLGPEITSDNAVATSIVMPAHWKLIIRQILGESKQIAMAEAERIASTISCKTDVPCRQQ